MDNNSRIIYTPSNFAKSSLLHVQEIGSLTATEQHTSKRENLDSYLFFVVHSGRGVLSYNNETFELSKGDCVFIDCKNPYYHMTSEDLWSLSWVHFNGPTAGEIYDKYIERGGLPAFHPVSFSAYVSVVSDLYKIAESDSYVRDMELNEGLSRLLVMLMTDSWNLEASKGSSKRSDLIDMRKYLDENHSKKITLDDLAERYYINKYYLTRIFKEQFGMSITNYLLSVRITHAKSLLRFTDKTAEEIGTECGIGPGYYFSRVFTSVEGMSPTEYRKTWASAKKIH